MMTVNFFKEVVIQIKWILIKEPSFIYIPL